MFAPKNILVPTDFSEYSDRAFIKALDIAHLCNSQIFLLHIIDRTIQLFVADYCLDNKLVERFEHESIITSNENLQKVIKRVAESKKVKIIPDVKRGIPSEEILKTQQEQEIDLIVIASHGKKGMKPSIGSVADEVVRGARCPVLLERNRMDKQFPDAALLTSRKL